MVNTFVHEITGKWPGKCWLSRFVKRWPRAIQSKYLLPIDSARKKADSLWSYSEYFGHLQQKMQQYEVEPENMYNVDEKGFMISTMKKQKRVFIKEAYERGSLLGNIHDGKCRC
ncbi:uncharacterized protein MYCFIDRAFT_133522 [Pseudocercospora fijiensis CIRAD86]|uniref:HTH CENPB-type domain-containing protein n=1 Tax=Pseudocercospora fijiensis (strain CIRAD86) TaxID=383855 RepID=M3AIY1_PSEFD|nr:uncharacterized protein MYCFIDRAFT_133522 [Pseudocercospora fijiensis CIRAD86]EME84556.1 hypothetical protein MYCFIDRAFT_133522 [Pseudocercospora fijiensis CIRAD86]